MYRRPIRSCHVWTVEVDDLIEAVGSDQGELELDHMIASLPGRHEIPVENPCRMSVEAELRRLCSGLGLPHVEHCFSPQGVGRLAALCFPAASREILRICSMTMVLALIFDDTLDRRKRSCEEVQALGDALKAALAGPYNGHLKRHPLIRLAGEIRLALREVAASETWMMRFLSAFEGFVDMSVKGYGRWLAGDGSASLLDYLQERYDDIGVAPMLALMELTHGEVLDEQKFYHEHFIAQRSACIFYMAFVNDVFSYHKEVIQTGNLTNAIAVVQMQYQLSFSRAAAAVVLMAQRCFDEFSALARRILSDSSMSESERRYVRGMSAWLAGALQWSVESERYRHPDSPFPELRAPRFVEVMGAEERLARDGDAHKRELADERGRERPATQTGGQSGRGSESPSATVTRRRTASI